MIGSVKIEAHLNTTAFVENADSSLAKKLAGIGFRVKVKGEE